MCGIFGIIKNRTTTDNDLLKLYILGLYNEDRGRDSCGLFHGGQVLKGVDKESKFKDFIQAYIFQHTKENLVSFGHCRSATRGAKNEENAHPFEIFNDDGKRILVGVHNGTITNTKTLAQKYNVEEKNVDSHTIFEILKDKDNTNVFKDYIGAGVFIYTYDDEPDTMYIFKGKSKKYNTSQIALEERPLFIYQHGDSVIVSSLIEPLYVLGGDSKTIKEVECNQLIKIKQGKYKFRPINREESFQELFDENDGYWEGYHHNNYNNNTYNIRNRHSNQIKIDIPETNVNITDLLSYKTIQELLSINIDIRKEKVPNTVKGDKLQFYRNRYYRNGHLYSPTKGYSYIGRDGTICDNKVADLIADVLPNYIKFKDGSIANLYWFFRGVIINDKDEYDSLIKLVKDNTIEKVEIVYLQTYTKYPYTSKQGTHCKFIDKNSKNVTGRYTYPFCSNVYTYNNGYLVLITESEQSTKKEEVKLTIIDKETDEISIDNDIKSYIEIINDESINNLFDFTNLLNVPNLTDQMKEASKFILI